MNYIANFALFCAGVFVGFLIFKGSFKDKPTAAIASILEDNAGGLSSIRVVMTGWFIAIGITWVLIAFRTDSLPDIPDGVLSLTAMVLGGKVVQRFGEKPSEPEINNLTL